MQVHKLRVPVVTAAAAAADAPEDVSIRVILRAQMSTFHETVILEVLVKELCRKSLHLSSWMCCEAMTIEVSFDFSLSPAFIWFSEKREISHR